MTGNVHVSLLAAGELPTFMAPLALIVVSAAIVAWLSHRAGLVPIVGFLAAGVAIGPNSLGLVDNVEVVEAAAEVGVILLLFTIGIEFSLERLNRVRRLVLGGGALTVVLATVVVAALVVAFGQSWSVGIYTGLLVSVSSTAVVLSLLASRGGVSAPSGQLSVAVLIFEDVAVVAMVLLVPMLGSEGGSALEIAQALGTSALVIGAVLGVATRVMPPVLDAIARTCSTEVFLLAVIGICFGTAYVTGLLGVSVSLGAFLAGLMVSESRYDTQALSEVLPLQIIFTAVFFLSVGMLLDPQVLADNLALVVAAIVGVLVIKSVTGVVAAAAVGVALPVAIGSSVMRAQIGEFSFVLEQAGRESGLSPLGLGETGVQVFLAVSVLLMVLTPVLTPAGEWLGALVGRRWSGTRDRGPVPGDDASVEGALVDHVVVSGWGPGARAVVDELVALDVPHVVVTLNPDGATEAAADHRVVIGDLAHEVVQHQAGLDRSRMVVVADDEPERALALAAVARGAAPRGAVVVRVVDPVEVEHAARAGVDHLVEPAGTTTQALASTVRWILAGDGGTGRAGVGPSAVVRVPAVPGGCAHLAVAGAVVPSAPGCADCLRAGASDWVHLRLCTACGHVGCCDSSPGRHARAHHRLDDHPVVRSLEPGETWLYCFEHDLTVDPGAGPEPVAGAGTAGRVPSEQRE